jgi:hypothetical protein
MYQPDQTVQRKCIHSMQSETAKQFSSAVLVVLPQLAIVEATASAVWLLASMPVCSGKCMPYEWMLASPKA